VVIQQRAQRDHELAGEVGGLFVTVRLGERGESRQVGEHEGVLAGRHRSSSASSARACLAATMSSRALITSTRTFPTISYTL
jgi:hypothetical protein